MSERAQGAVVRHRYVRAGARAQGKLAHALRYMQQRPLGDDEHHAHALARGACAVRPQLIARKLSGSSRTAAGSAIPFDLDTVSFKPGLRGVSTASLTPSTRCTHFDLTAAPLPGTGGDGDLRVAVPCER